MFWGRRSKNVLQAQPSLQALAGQLGVERRFAVRVYYPLQTTVCRLPQIYFQGQRMTVQNISTGGCLLLDPSEILGPAIAEELNLELDWSTTVETVKSRIISRVDNRRHIQFLDLNAKREAQLIKSMASGVRGLSMSRHASAADIGPTLQAAELWSSPLTDSLILENDIHRLAQVQLDGEQYSLFREAWPSKNGERCSRPEFENIILFIANIPRPSAHVRGLQKSLEDLLLAAGGG